MMRELELYIGPQGEPLLAKIGTMSLRDNWIAGGANIIN